MQRTLLKNGTIIDGTGTQGFLGDVLLEDERIACVSRTPIQAECETVDCSGKAIAPGFIDAHSHNDWFLASANDINFIEPFIRQGITTFVGGNCGYGVAGIKKGSLYKRQIRDGLLAPGIDQDVMPWDTWPEYFDFVGKRGPLANLAVLAGHGTSLGSVAGLVPPKSGGYTADEIKETHRLLEEGMDDGCKGVSLGLAYRPGLYVDLNHVREIAKLVAKRGKVLAVHRAVERNAAPPGEEGLNVKWLRSFFEIAADTGVRVEISHLVFPWRNTWPTFDAVLGLIDDCIDRGMDLWFDLYSYGLGASEIAIVLPPEIHTMVPQIYTDKGLQEKLAEKLAVNRKLIGQKSSDIQLANPIAEELQPYKGMFLDEIAEARGIPEFESTLDIYKKTSGTATIYMYAHYAPGQIERLMVHPHVLYMTDAWIEDGCLQNPAAYGSMPRFLRLARELKNMSVEQVVARMTGKTAGRFDIKERGLLRDGFYADLVVFRPDTIAEDADCLRRPDSYPVGIEHVYINGAHVVEGGRINFEARSGKIV